MLRALDADDVGGVPCWRVSMLLPLPASCFLNTTAAITTSSFRLQIGQSLQLHENSVLCIDISSVHWLQKTSANTLDTIRHDTSRHTTDNGQHTLPVKRIIPPIPALPPPLPPPWYGTLHSPRPFGPTQPLTTATVHQKNWGRPRESTTLRPKPPAAKPTTSTRQSQTPRIPGQGAPRRRRQAQ